MAYKGYVNKDVQAMYGIPYSQLTAEQKRILHEDSKRRAKLIEETQQQVMKNNLKAYEDEAKLEKVLGKIYRDCQKQILASVSETIAKVEKAGGTWSYANQSALTRSRGLFEQITAELNKLGQKEQAVFTQGLGNIYTDQFLRQVYTLGQSITIKANFNRLNPALVKRTLDYPWSGAMFSDRIWQDKEKLGRNLREGLTQSMILGEGIPEITERINKNIGTAQYNAERVARTETKRVTYVAHNDVYEDTGVEKLRYYTSGMKSASEVCGTCKKDNGKIFKRGEEPTLPRHPNCKCVYVPVVDDTFKMGELNELTGSIRGAESYEKWIKANKDKINPDGSLKDGWVRDWKNGGKLVNKNAPVDGTFSKEEIDEALEFYVSGEGMYINSHLAGEFEKNGGVWTEEDEKILKLLDAGTMDVIKDKKLYRSVDASAVFGNMTDTEFADLQDYLFYGEKVLPKNKVDKIKKSLNIDGKEITEPRFMSTTRDKDIALEWGGFTGSDKPIVLEFDVPDGVRGADLSRFDITGDEQREVLLHRGAKYKIKGITAEGGSLVVKAELLPHSNVLSMDPVNSALLKDAVKNDKVTLSKVDPIKLTDYPQPFYATKAEAKNTQTLLDFINNAEKADPDVVGLYRNLDKAYNFLEKRNIPFSISHGKNHAVTSWTRIDGRIAKTKLCIPKLTGEDIIGAVDTTLHEEMHFLDFLLGKDTRDGISGAWVSASNSKLTKALSTSTDTIGDKIKELFKKHDDEHKKISEELSERYLKESKALSEKYFPNGVFGKGAGDYSQYKKDLNKINSSIEEERDYRSRNIMGGGIGLLQDIYDALSKGNHRQSGAVIYGHGRSYFASHNNRTAEILANYGALSVAHPELVDMLAEDKPELVEALRDVVKEMLKEVK